jgi:FkbM family methyltransferase
MEKGEVPEDFSEDEIEDGTSEDDTEDEDEEFSENLPDYAKRGGAKARTTNWRERASHLLSMKEHYTMLFLQEQARQQALQRHLNAEGSAGEEKPAESAEEAPLEQAALTPEEVGMQLYPEKLSGGGGLLKKAPSLTVSSSSDVSSCHLPNGASWCTVKPATGRNFEMAVYKGNDVVSDGICSNGFWEVHDVSDLGTPGTALDIGANIGFYSFLLADAGWQVESFEVLPKNQELIQATACRNPQLAQNITLLRTGLGPRNDNCVFISGLENVGDGMVQCGDDAARIQSAKDPVVFNGNEYGIRGNFSVKRLDDILMMKGAPANIDFVKIDVEGFECQVFKGAESILKYYRPRKIQSEVWSKMQGCLNTDYLNIFKQANYEVARTRGCERPDSSLSGDIQDFFMCRKEPML